MTEAQVTSKGQVTIPIDLRKKYKIEKGGKVNFTEENGKIVLTRKTSILDLAGIDAGTADIKELHTTLDKMREEDAEKQRL